MSSNNVVYFVTTAAGSFYPTALWVSDGTAAGTKLIASYAAGDTIVPLENLAGAFLYTVSSPGNTDFDLTLGTALSTHTVLNAAFSALPLNALTNNVAFLNPFEAVGGITYGNGTVTVGMVNLLNPDPTLLLMIPPQSFASPETVGDFTAVNGDAFFVDANAHGVANLYRTDGTVGGTENVISAPNFANLTAETNATSGTRLFLSEVTSGNHGELLAIGTADTAPTLIDDFGAGTSVASITDAGNTLFIVTNDAGGTQSLWQSDGSDSAPTLIQTFSTSTMQQILAAADGSARIYFQLGDEVWTATATGATELDSFASVSGLFVLGSGLYFAADDGTDHTQLWSSDGTPAGTSQIAIINPTGDADPANFANLNGTLYFSATDGVHGDELWSWNGSTASMVTDLDPGAAGSDPTLITPGETASPATGSGLVSFNTQTGVGITDGTLAGTSVVYGLLPPEVLSFLLPYSNGTSIDLTISHGTAGTTITVPVANPAGLLGGANPLTYTSNGAYFTYTTVNFATASETATLEFIGDTALAPVSLGAFAPAISGGVATIADRVASGAQEYFLVERSDGNGKGTNSQLWSSDGSATGTTMVVDLGLVNDPSSYTFLDGNGGHAVTAGTGWAALLADDTTGAVSLFTATGTVGNFSQVTPASIGLAGTIDNSGSFSLAFAGSKYFFSMINAGTIEAVATDTTSAHTDVLTSEIPASGSQTYGDFTASGSLVYFDDGVGGALYVSDGSTAGTRSLLTSGAFIAPYIGQTPVLTPSTASVTAAGKTLFYFVATVGGQTGLYFSDGSTVTAVKASGLADNAYITASDSTVYFVADGGTGFTTIWSTSAGSSSASPVINPSLFPPDSLYGTAFGAPQNPTALQDATVYPFAPDTFFLTPGTDTVAGGAGDTSIYSDADSLNPGDNIDGGGGINDLYLTGTGTFDLSQPTTLANITQVLADSAGATIDLRNDTTLTVELTGGGELGDTIVGADDADTITGSGNDTVFVGSSNETISQVGKAVITAATENAQISTAILEVVGGGTVTLGDNISVTQAVSLDAPTDLIAGLNSFDTVIHGSSGKDTITLTNSTSVFGTSVFVVTGGGGDDLFIIAPTGSGVIDADFRDTAANLNGGTIEGFNFVPNEFSSDTIDVTDFAFGAGESAILNGDVLTISNAGSTASTQITLTGAPAGGGFVLAADGSTGTQLTYIPQLFTLTTGIDTITGTTTNQITAAADTLSSGDTINGGVTFGATFTSALQLVGAGTFDLGLPAVLTGLSSITGDTTGSNIGGSDAIDQTILLRNGMTGTITLGAGHDTVFGASDAATILSLPENFGTAGYNVFVGDARESVELSGQAEDVIHVTAATGQAPVSDNLQGSFQTTGVEEVDGGGIAGISTGVFGNTSLVKLAQPTDAIFTGTAPDDITGSTGTDTIDVTNAGASSFGGSITVDPNGGGDTVKVPINDGLVIQGSAAQLNDTTIDGFNFLPAAPDRFGITEVDTIDITDLANPGSVTTEFSGGTLSVLNNGILVDTFLLPDAPSVGSFVPKADSAKTGTALTFSTTSTITSVAGTLSTGEASFVGTPGFDSLTVPEDTLAAGQTLDGSGGVNELLLTGTGSFDLGLPAVLDNFQVLNVGSAETVTLRAGDPMALIASDATIIGADASDTIVLDSDSFDDTVVVGSPAATVIDGTGFATNIFSISAATNGVTIYGNHDGSDKLQVTGAGGVLMGSNIYDISEVDLTPTGAVFYANGELGLALKVSGTATLPGAKPDTVFAGAGGDAFTDSSTGGNNFIAGAGDDTFTFNVGAGDSLPISDTIYNFDVGGSDTIEVSTLDTGVVNFSGGTLTVGAPTDRVRFSVALGGTYVGKFTAIAGENGGTSVTFAGTVTPAGNLPCFAAGTRLLTASGEVAVEALREGDLLAVQFGRVYQPIVWAGHRRVDCIRHPKPGQVWPVRVAAHAFGPGRPHTDLFLSPDHGVYINDVLIPVKYLINGTSIVQVPVSEVTYYHVELPQHDVVLAEGLLAESYLDVGDRANFANGGGAITLHPDFASCIWEARGCAPLVVAGAKLDAARWYLNQNRLDGREEAA